ncbi:NADH-quinone oxidoreductase subunit NuoB [Burkholderia ambifaria]|uniref:NADH-quinone oxidoreductase subunit NuoB n=1 Tax=Burkholderia ambifaria TaxID=152480 RepID=UPI001589EF9B|nr:NADH-quinone oxidoreductase subunit NuoB [Burkholderia ambifaria]
MALWTWFGLRQGSATTGWPREGEAHGQDGMLGMPRYAPAQCDDGCEACAQACVTRAISITLDEDGKPSPQVDWGRCIVCQRCAQVCPTQAFSPSNDWAVAVRHRQDLVWRDVPVSGNPERERVGQAAPFKRSLHIRHVDAGSCNGCESELQALNNPFYNLHRLGIFFTASPRFADVLLVTGAVTHAMRAPLLATYEAMPEPKWVVAAGTCAVSGGVTAGNYACGNGLDGVLPVDIYLPGCPPNPAALMHALLLIVGKAEQRMRGGQIER